MQCGAVTFPRPPHDGDEAISIADHLMYQVKYRGKGTIAYGVFDYATGKVVDWPDSIGFDFRHPKREGYGNSTTVFRSSGKTLVSGLTPSFPGLAQFLFS